ncbi:MAG: hypothetical protein ACRDH8_04485 [Actinomycetota bacterium]
MDRRSPGRAERLWGRSQAILIAIGVGVASFFAVSITVARFWVASIPFMLFLLTFLVRRDWWVFGALSVWALYGVWEALIQYQVTCDAECNIRVDLLLIFPVVIVASVIGAWRAVQHRGNGSAPPRS